MTTRNQQPMYAKPIEPLGDVPFGGDLFRRKVYADKLTLLLDQLAAGSVIGIDAEWGSGKTWFGKNWAAQLAQSGHKTVYLDGFEQDYSEDAFVPISSEIIQLIKADEKLLHQLIEKSKKVALAILPTSSKIVVNFLGKLIGTTDLSGELLDVFKNIQEHAADAAESYVESRLKEHEQEKQAISEFRKTLAEFAESQDKPVIFFIDELDRCRPTFAVQVIERIKHFFNVPNLIFVLLINRKQLELSFTGVYGPIDAHAYLGKFINIYFGLPPVRQTGINLNKIFLRNLAVRYKFGDEAGVGEFIEHFSAIATDMGMSFRDLEKAMTYFTLADTRWRGALLVWPIALKVSKADLFTRLSRKEPLAIDESLQLITALNNGEQHNYYYIPSAITALVNGSATEEQKQYLNRFHFTLDNGLLWAIFKAIDVSIQD